MSNVPAVSDQNLPDNRFELELEFIQSLASPAYLYHLATQGYFQETEDQDSSLGTSGGGGGSGGSSSFIDFLRYLRSYWTKPEYAKYITYPHCFFFLDLLIENETFRKEIAQVPFRNFVHEQQFFNWQYRSRVLYGSGVTAVEEQAAKVDGMNNGVGDVQNNGNEDSTKAQNEIGNSSATTT